MQHVICNMQEVLLGRGEGCDIRIQLPVVSKEHARLRVTVDDGKVGGIFVDILILDLS